jgi:serine/threonine-protein kinase
MALNPPPGPTSVITPAIPIDPKYEVLRKLREGGMGAVYLVRHRLLGELRVVKVLRAQLALDSDLRARFLREARMASQLRHPNIAQLYDFSVDEQGNAAIVLEYIDGVTFEDLRHDPAGKDLAFVLDLAGQGLRALGFLHRRGFVHRDISPDNLMVTLDVDGHPLVKLIDLGIAKNLRPEVEGTVTQAYFGKPRYSSPEHLAVKLIDNRSDLYSFAILLYELLTDRHPVPGDDIASLIAGHLFRPPLSFAESDPQGRLPASLRALVLTALAKEPADRPATAELFAESLAAIARTDIPASSAPASTLFAAIRAASTRRKAAARAAAREEVEGLLAIGNLDLARSRLAAAIDRLGDDPELAELWQRHGDLRAAEEERTVAPTRELDDLAPTVQLDAAVRAPPVSPPGASPAVPTVMAAPAPASTAEALAPPTLPPAAETRSGGRRAVAIVAVLLVAGVGGGFAARRFLAGGPAVPESYRQGLVALDAGDPAAAARLLRTAIVEAPVAGPGYAPQLQYARALAAAGDCAGALAALPGAEADATLGAEERATRAQLAATVRGQCATAVPPAGGELAATLAGVDEVVALLERHLSEIAGTKANAAVRDLFAHEPDLDGELTVVAGLVADAKRLAAEARAKGDLGAAYQAGDRAADARARLAAVERRLAGASG